MSWRADGYSSEIERMLIVTQQLDIASVWVTLQVIRQKSADGILAGALPSRNKTNCTLAINPKAGYEILPPPMFTMKKVSLVPL
jgi:hypothetical protein